MDPNVVVIDLHAEVVAGLDLEDVSPFFGEVRTNGLSVWDRAPRSVDNRFDLASFRFSHGHDCVLMWISPHVIYELGKSV